MDSKEKSQKFYEVGLQATKLYLYDVAIKYLTKASDLGNADAMYLLGIIYDESNYGFGYELHKENELSKFSDNEQAFKWYKRAAEKGCKKAFLELALYYLERDNLEYNKRAAKKWLTTAINWNQTAAEKGDPFAMLELAGIYSQYNFTKTLIYGGLPGKDSLGDKWRKFAFVTFKRLANEGDVEAMLELSTMFHYGNGTTKSDAESIRWLKTAAEAGDDKIKIRAYQELAYIVKSNADSISFSKKAADLGDFTSMRILWNRYKTGKGVRKNLSAAERWLKKSEEIQAAFLANLPEE